MAEESIKAFGRYLKALRERRGISLDEVASLSQTFPEKINKGYLSRCENGRQKLGFSKVIALSRIYEVPADVLVERMELDLELDRVGGPVTEGRSFSELTEAGKKAMEQGYFLKAYAYLRDAVPRSSVDPLRDSYQDRAEQVVVAQMNAATGAKALGRDRFPLHEFLYLDQTGHFGPRMHPVLLERISSCYRALSDSAAAEEYANLAIEEAEAHGDQEYLGYLYSTRARIAVSASEIELATDFFNKSYVAHKSSKQPVGCALALNSLAQCHFDMKRYKSARRAAEASYRVSTSHGRLRSRAFSLLLLGEIDELEQRPTQALRRWKAAAEIARKLRDRELRFKAEFLLLKRALKTGNAAAARAIKRRLNRLRPGVSKDTVELEAFCRILEGRVDPSLDLVAVPQRPSKLSGN